MIAIISHSVEFAVNRVRSQGNLKSYDGVTRKGLFESDREFIIAVRPQDLRGVDLTDYIVEGRPDPELIEVARARVR